MYSGSMGKWQRMTVCDFIGLEGTRWMRGNDQGLSIINARPFLEGGGIGQGEKEPHGKT